MYFIHFLTVVIALGISLNPIHTQANFILTSPAPYQIIQQQRGSADIPITGTVNGEGSIEARFNGGEWQTIARIRSGAFSGVLPAQAAGQGGLEVRVVEAPELTIGVPYVGIGDVFIIAGQSNASGRGFNSQAVSHAWLKAGLFGNDYLWHELTDPSDNNGGQVDTVSIDLEAAGSVWTLVATHYLNERSIPIAFVPAAHGGSSISAWLPGRSRLDRATLYGSMLYRARLTGAKAVLFWQGETDALESMAQADYQRQFTQFAAAVRRDLGVPLVPALIHNSTGIPDENEAAVRQAVIAAAQSSPMILLGPDLSDLASDDQYHLQSDSNLQSAAERWWQVLRALG